VNAGYTDEAQAWREWLLRAVAGSPQQLQIMYGLAGERRLTEWEVPWLPGYERSAPVRIGNAAYGQLQLDVFGEAMDALHQARCLGLAASESGWAVQLALLSHLEQIWQQPDEGIWEVRGGPQCFTYSKVMAWVAFDRAIKSAERFGLEGPVEHWRRLAAHIHRDVCERGFDRELGSFVQSYGSKRLDASLLLLPAVGFLPADDARVRGTVKAIEQHLMRDGFVLRYHTAETGDGLPPGEGVFLACSFWLVDAYVLDDRVNEAVELFDRLIALRNDVGLLSEQYDPKAGSAISRRRSPTSRWSTAPSICRDSKNRPVDTRAWTKWKSRRDMEPLVGLRTLRAHEIENSRCDTDGRPASEHSRVSSAEPAASCARSVEPHRPFAVLVRE
jgi:GH15 family glucan-1,4-alpha-glucosidase